MDWDIIKEDLVQGKDVNLTYLVTDEYDSGYDLEGKQLDMTVVDKRGIVVKEWTSSGATPHITIFTIDEDDEVQTYFNIQDSEGFTDFGVFKGELIDNTNDDVIAFFIFSVEKQITPVSE